MKNLQNQKVLYEVRALFGLIQLKFEIPKIKAKGPKEGVEIRADAELDNLDQEVADIKKKINVKEAVELFQDIKLLKNHVYHFPEWSKGALSNIKCIHFHWTTKIGIEEAPSTAMAIGGILGVKSSFVSFLSKRIKLLQRPDIRVIPFYNQLLFSTDLTIHMKVRHFHALLAVSRLLFRIMIMKNGFKVWSKMLHSFYLAWKDKKNTE